MHDILVILIHSIVTLVRLMKPGGLRAVVAESALTRHQILLLNRSRKRAPNPRVSDRRALHPSHAPISSAAMRYCPKGIDAAAFPSRPDESKVPHAVFIQARRSARSEGAGPRIDRGWRLSNSRTLPGVPLKPLGACPHCSQPYSALGAWIPGPKGWR